VPEVVPSFETRVDAPSGVAEHPVDGTDEAGDEKKEETDEDEFLQEYELYTYEMLTEF